MHCIRKVLWTTNLTQITASHCIFFNDAYQSTTIRDLTLPLPESSNKPCTEGVPNPSGAQERWLPTALFQLHALLLWWLCAVWCAVQFAGQFAAAGPLSGLNMRSEKSFVASLTSCLLPHQLTNSCVCTEKPAVISFISLLHVDSNCRFQADTVIWVSVAL